MTFLATPNPGDPNWGPPLNASLNALQQRIDALSAKLPLATPGDAGKIISVSNTGAYQLATPSAASGASLDVWKLAQSSGSLDTSLATAPLYATVGTAPSWAALASGLPSTTVRGFYLLTLSIELEMATPPTVGALAFQAVLTGAAPVIGIFPASVLTADIADSDITLSMIWDIHAGSSVSITPWDIGLDHAPSLVYSELTIAKLADIPNP